MIFLIWGSYVNAAVVSDLYQASVPVADQSAQARKEAIEQALLEVLGKVSGNTSLKTVPQIQEQLHNASNLLRQYRYESSTSTPLGATGMQLRVFFDDKAINQLLLKTGQAIWPSNRPRIAVWIALIDDNDRKIISNSDDQTNHAITYLVSWLMQHTAEHYGIPIQLPNARLIKTQAIALGDIATFQSMKVLPLQTVMQSDGLLMGRLIRTPDHQWQATWYFTLRNEHYQWQRVDSDLNTVFNDLYRNLTDSLAEQFAILASDEHSNKVVMRIDEVNNAKAYAKVIHYLIGLPLVSEVNVTNVADNHITVYVNAQGGAQALQQALNFGHTLVKETDSEAHTMRYQLVL